VKEYEFTALVEYGLTIEAENETEAKQIVYNFSTDGWKINGEPIGVSDIELIAEREIK